MVGGPMRNAQMYLQGIEPAARLQLLALCLASLERQTLLLRELNIRYNSSRGWEWGGSKGGLLHGMDSLVWLQGRRVEQIQTSRAG